MHRPMRRQRPSLVNEFWVFWWSAPCLLHFPHFKHSLPHLHIYQMNGTRMLKMKKNQRRTSTFPIYALVLPITWFLEPPTLTFFLFQWADYPCSVSNLPSSVTGFNFPFFELLFPLGFWSYSFSSVSVDVSCETNLILKTSRCCNVPELSLESPPPSTFPL